MNFLNLLENDKDENPLEKKAIIERIIADKVPDIVFDFISNRKFEKNYFDIKMYEVKPFFEANEALILQDETFCRNPVIFSFYIVNNIKYCKCIRFFMDLSRIVYLLSESDFEMHKAMMIEHKICYLADINNDEYWAIGIDKINTGKIYYVDTWNETIIEAFNSLDDFFKSFFIASNMM